MRLLFGIIFFLAAPYIYGQQKTLDYFISSAKTNSPVLKGYNNQTRSNLIDSARIAAGYKPQVSIVSNNSYAPVVNGYGYESAITNIGDFSELITASKQFVGKENLTNQYGFIRLMNDSLRIAGRITTQDLIKSITAQYITAYGSSQQYFFNKEVYDLLSREDSILKQLTQAAVYRQTDYLTFFVTLQQQKTTTLRAKNQFQNDYALLNYECGLFDTSFAALARPEIQLASIQDAQSTVYYEKYHIDSLLLQNEHAAIDFSYKPKIRVFADAGYVSTFAYRAYKNFGTSFGVNLTIPIYDGRQKKMQHEKIAISEQTRQQYRKFFVTQYHQQVALLMQQLNTTQQIIDQTNDQLKYVEGLLQANGKLLATGDVHISDYIIAINNYLTAKNIITQMTITRLQLITQINYWNSK